MDLIEELSNLVSKLKQERIEFALCGGLAMAIYAFPRATMDIDIMIEQDSVSKVKEIAEKLGFSVDAGMMEFQKGAIKIQRLVKITPEFREGLVLDLLIVTDKIQDVWQTRKEISWEKGVIPVISPEGLIRLKTMRNKGQDRDDIEHLKGLINET